MLQLNNKKVSFCVHIYLFIISQSLISYIIVSAFQITTYMLHKPLPFVFRKSAYLLTE